MGFVVKYESRNTHVVKGTRQRYAANPASGYIEGIMSRRWRAAVTPATVIVIVTGCFHLYRGAPLDGVVFLTVGAALIASGFMSAPALTPAVVPSAKPRRYRPAAPRRIGAIGIALVAGTIAGSTGRYSIGEAVLVIVIGLPVLIASWPERRGEFAAESGPPMLRAEWAWAGLGLAVALWELAAYLLEGSPRAEHAHPSISDLLDPALNIAPARAAFALCWVLTGYALLRWRRQP